MLDHLKGIQAGGSTPKDNKTAMNRPIDPLASLCLGAVRGWIRVVQHGKGGQIDKDGIAWTRLPAAELRDQLAQEFHVQASIRSIQRALKRLAEADLLRREQRLKHRYWRDYWYALPAGHEEANSPRTIPAIRLPSKRRTRSVSTQTTPMAGQADKPVTVETTPMAGQVLYTQIKDTHLFSEGVTAARETREDKKLEEKQERAAKTPSGGKSLISRMGLRRRKPPEGFKAPRPADPETGKRFVERPEQVVGIDCHGRVLREVWVSGFRHLVVD